MEGTIVKENYDGVTKRSLQAWNELKTFEPVELFIYKNSTDAILQGFYKYKPNPYVQGLYDIHEVPHFIAKDKYGDEFRTSGLNCGYGGEGPRGTISILKQLGVDNAERIVTGNAVVYIDMKHGNPKVEAGRSVFDDYLRDPMERTFESAKVYNYGERLVFTESDESRDTLGFLKFYLERVIDEVEAVYFLVDEDEILSYRRRAPKRYTDRIMDFPIAIRGKNGIEIWLKPYLSNIKRLEEQTIVKNVLEVVGFPPLNRDQGILDKVKNTLSGKPIERSAVVIVESGQLELHYL